MNASIVDLRYKTKQILAALDRQETVSVLYHGKLRGKIVPAAPRPGRKVEDSDFFGMRAKEGKSVAAVMRDLRGGRHRGL
jgi:antitoxin (DNA-binding transcriptional repressor) of toxin-antitoxin stability system